MTEDEPEIPGYVCIRTKNFRRRFPANALRNGVLRGSKARIGPHLRSPHGPVEREPVAGSSNIIAANPLLRV